MKILKHNLLGASLLTAFVFSLAFFACRCCEARTPDSQNVIRSVPHACCPMMAQISADCSAKPAGKFILSDAGHLSSQLKTLSVQESGSLVLGHSPNLGQTGGAAGPPDIPQLDSLGRFLFLSIHILRI